MDVIRLLHVDEIDHDDSGDLTESELSSNLFRSLEIRVQDGRLLIAVFDIASGVDIDCDERLRFVDDDRSAAFQRHPSLKALLNLAFDVVLLE